MSRLEVQGYPCLAKLTDYESTSGAYRLLEREAATLVISLLVRLTTGIASAGTTCSITGGFSTSPGRLE
jgi:hypothetical protein